MLKRNTSLPITSLYPLSAQTILQDSFKDGLFKRLPKDTQASFTPEQIDALRIAFGANNKWGRHPVDVRGTFKLWRWRYYFVILVGRNRRDLSRRERQISLFAKAFAVSLFLTFSLIVGLLALYLLKSALGIDLFPNHSLGIWSWFKSSF
jgi:hypothetical protein